MKGLREKFRKNEGFTLVEMLIVVAIIAILVAVSIPLVNNALDRARHATDEANERAAKAEILVQYLAGSDAVFNGATQTAGISTAQNYYYDAQSGGLVTTALPQPYGQCLNRSKSANEQVVMVRIDTNGNVTMQWVSAMTNDVPTNTGLCGSAKNAKHT